MATLQDLKARIAKLQAQAEEIAKKESSTALAKIHQLLEKHGLTTADVDAFRVPNESRRAGQADTSNKPAGAAKYADPKTGATWTGHGRAPAWIANARNRSRFLVDGDRATPPVAARKQAKTGNYLRGPQAPKYRDPVSGATWSGRGKAPAWLAGAKDRATYLIDKVTDEPVAPDTAPAKKTTAKKVASKKVGAKKAVTKEVASKNVATGKTAGKKAASKTTAVKKAAAKKGRAPGRKMSAKKVQMTAEAPTSAVEERSGETSATTTA
ncbi:H-NS family nucleoid-associated regulatory protein [Caballeronia sp. RCC_10]|uniref:H-NS family nucleoid-associated regulatory protein n=1 Tax=Caballeronia sp. RCC_10 TaxID=3239227 RepID=UPI003524574A